MTKSELEAANSEFVQQAELDRLNIHNRLNQDCRQPDETIQDYARRLAAAQMFSGYDGNDFVTMLPTFSKDDAVRAKKHSLA